ncbi:SMP-30/gluconolactonase/LRE family protein (plasmid) [Sulfitobacter sp. W074]|nr:SMP-30/gluconolactonase/LRE family protein [Sulfitobacter sp. W074]
MTIERFGKHRSQLGESPRWDEEKACLWQMDCRAGKIFRFERTTGSLLTCLDVPAPCGSLALNADGDLIVALKETLLRMSPDGSRSETLARIDDSHSNLRLNDSVGMADGSLIVGTMHVFRASGEAPLGGLYRLTPNSALQQVDSGIAVTNGPCVSPISGRFHVCDSAAREIYSYAIDTEGQLTDKKLFATTNELASSPDGCCFDTEGGLWTALVHAAAVVRYDPEGKLTHRINLPLSHPAGICFGGAGLDELFVTSISDSGRLRAEGPFDGATLRISGGNFRGNAQPRTQIAPSSADCGS